MNDQDIERHIRDVLARQGTLLVPPKTDVGGLVGEWTLPPGETAGKSTDRPSLSAVPSLRRNGERHRRRHSAAVVAALVLAALGVAGAVLALRPDDSSVSTDLPSTTAPKALTTTTRVPDRLEDTGFQLGGGQRLLPPAEEWVMVSYEEYEFDQPGGDQAGSDVYVFEQDGHMFMLTVGPSGGEEAPFSLELVEVLFNRATLYWDVEGRRLGLTGFDVDADELFLAADALIEIDRRWSLPGAREVLVEQETRSSPGPTAQIEFAPIAEDGTVDLSRSVLQVISERSLGSLYRELGEASSLGATRPIEIAGATGFVITGSSPQYALHYAEGYVSSWQTSTASVDLEHFVDVLAPSSSEGWAAAIEMSKGVRRAALEASAAAIRPIPVVEVPRFVLPEPWELTDVFDQSQWTAGERAQDRALVEATNGRQQYRVAWAQTFRRIDNIDALVPDVLVEVQEVIEPFPPIIEDSSMEPIAVGDFEGVLTIAENGQPRIIVTLGDVAIEIQSPTLTGSELSSFAASLIPRPDGVMGGFDINNEDFRVGVDIQSPYDETADGTGTWSAVWRNEARTVFITLEKAPAEIAELRVAFSALYFGSASEPIPGRPFIQIDGDGSSQVIWHRPDLGVDITVNSETNDALDAAQSLVQISEDEWVATVAPFIEPPDPEGGN